MNRKQIISKDSAKAIKQINLIGEMISITIMKQIRY